MARDKQHNPDPNENASRIVAESVGDSDALPADAEAAWQEWSAQIQNVDERGMTLLRAAFEAGHDAAAQGAAASLGRAGGLKGGKARAESLSATKRSEIARKAAAARWNTDNR
ncbi:hypothetical protein KOR34_15710 [Posidoniimonas corsicana]|uniref:Uncharacterized protein n=1 Tax=Posidoniimonas corsicana TaxID=1938618 RepID=A0A5C5VG67_9BACT|nr:hypothetical protein [Posidoniimonas corsicana]TWT36632.1 hypothetical protein KOR34_15710 [Posidoniimonas corsicana]